MWEKRLRLWSGLIVTVYLIPHLFNHSLGLISLDAMEAMRKVMSAIWFGPPGGPLLIGAFLLHFFLSLFSLYSRSTLRMPVWEATQISLGILIFPLILVHIIATQAAGQLFGFEPTYEYVIAAIWVSDPIRGMQQTFMMFIVWGHMCMGLHFWLRLRPWYKKWTWLIYGSAILLPVLAFLGFARVGRQLTQIHETTPDYLERVFDPIIRSDPNMIADLSRLEPNIAIIFAFLIVSVFVGRSVRMVSRNRHGTYKVTIPDGRTFSAPIGQTILETLRTAGVPHAAVCGGRGRCTTCRVHVGQAAPDLPPADDVENSALLRVHADQEVRLACQLRPQRDLRIRPLLPPSATAQDANRSGGIQGREQKIACMFVDIRGSTKLGEEKLPYDVLFILNQFFAEMSEALLETRGHYAQFVGDGLMALYGTDGSIEDGCRNAIRGAAAMAQRLEDLNIRLKHELKEPLQMGIGVHYGDAIVGTMGPPTAQNFSAIGDVINVTARLEAKSKDYGCLFVVSRKATETAGVDATDHPFYTTDVRGRDGAIDLYAIDDPRTLDVPL